MLNTLKTRWASDVSPTNAWPEHPRPQMVREGWYSLNGLWEYAITDFDATAPDRYEVELGLTVAAIAGNFKGTVSIAEKNAPHSYKLGVEGSGRHGMVQGYALISLEPAGSGTEVRVAAQAHVGGLIARVGQRLLEGVARTTMDRFYGCLANSLSRRSV